MISDELINLTKSKRLFHNLQNVYFVWRHQSRYQTPYPVDQLLIYSYNNEYYAAGRLIKSAHHWKMPLTIDGIGQPIRHDQDRLIGLEHYLRNQAISDDTVLMLVDVNEAFIVGQQAEILRTF